MITPSSKIHNDMIEAMLAEDRRIFGTSYHTMDSDGTMYRINPMNVRRRNKGDSFELIVEGTELTTRDILIQQ